MVAAGRTAPDSFEALGLSISALSFEATLTRLLQAPGEGERLRVHFCALHTLTEAARNDELRASLNDGLVTPDGTPLKWLGRARGLALDRVCGPDMMQAVLERSPSAGLSHFFYGSTPDVLDDLVSALGRRYPGIDVRGAYSPPFRELTQDEVASTAAMINAARPDFVWVGLGSPKQDRWLIQFRPLLEAPVILAVGAAFDYLSGRTRRAPEWARNAGVEWLFRLQAEPGRLAGRYASAAVQFGWLLLIDLARRRTGRRSASANATSSFAGPDRSSGRPAGR